MTASGSMQPLVSVVVRNFNRGPRVARALASVFAQRFTDYELLVVDDASTDGSLEAAAPLLADPRVRVIERLRNGGAAAAANTALDFARGDYLAYLDSDDEWHPDYLAVHVAALERDGRAIMTHGPVIECWAGAGIERLVGVQSRRASKPRVLVGYCAYTQSTTVLRRSVFEELGRYDDSLKVSQDFEFHGRLAIAFEEPFLYIDRPLVRYAISEDGVTQDFARWEAEFVQVLERLYSRREAAARRDELPAAKARVALALKSRAESVRWVREVREASVSVLVHASGAGDLPGLQRTLASVFSQEGVEFEVVLVDDSGDEAIRGWLAGLDRADLKCVHFSEPRGAAACWNYGAIIAEGDFLALMDDASEWEPGYLHAHLAAHSLLPATPLFSHADVVGASLDGAHMPPFTAMSNDDYPQYLLLHGPFPRFASGFFVERALWQAVGGMNEGPLADPLHDLELRLLGQRTGGPIPRQWPARLNRRVVRRAGRSSTAGDGAPPDAAAVAGTFRAFFESEAGGAYRALLPQLLRARSAGGRPAG